MPPPLPSISTLPSLSTERRIQVLDTLFEPCTQLHTLAVQNLGETEFASYDALIAAVHRRLTALLNSNLTSDRDWLDAILTAHPRLGEKKIESELSRAEQVQIRGAEGKEEVVVGDKMMGLNQEYERVFQGLRYVVFVNGRSRRTIMEDMERRIVRAELRQERVDAAQALCDIASDRAGKLGEEPEA